MNPTVILQFDPETGKPTVFINGNSDLETAKVREMVYIMLLALEVNENENT